MKITRVGGRIWTPKKHKHLACLKNFWSPDIVLPASYDIDANLPNGIVIPTTMDLNDTAGDCVMAARAKQQRRFLVQETGIFPNITSAEIGTEYYSETGGPDSGLDPETSLELWR